jgi:hypothetical protein
MGALGSPKGRSGGISPRGEPEGYILDRPHDPALAVAIGDLWELVLANHATVQRDQIVSNAWDARIAVVGASWDGMDWFTAEGVGYTYVSARAKNWLEVHASSWIDFVPAPIV